MKIKVLDEKTINQIAAGEVIENPSSVVKELVENALDAGATEICIEIQGGGRQLIRVIDNGCGMVRDDALLCLERHATSKIRNIEEISDVTTMGFRGEAIPSIASISKLSLITCPQASSDSGTMVLVEGGKILQCSAAARSPGTTIEVKSLFFNVPVRKKFQRSPAYDTNEILKVISNLSLGYPLIKFQLISDQKILLSTPSIVGQEFLENLKQRVSDILGSDFADSSSLIDLQQEEIHIRGLIGHPSYTRPNRLGQHLFINQRFVVSPLVSSAIRNGYSTALPSQRFPVFVLHLSLPGKLVDVNVHPQKREVRLRQEQILRNLLNQAVSKTLQKSYSTFESQAFPICNSFSYSESSIEKPPFQLFEQKKWSFQENQPPQEFSFEIEERSTAPIQEQLLPLTMSEQTVKVIATIKNYFIIDATTLPQPSEGLCIVDQKAAQVRILFEQLCEFRNKKISSQYLLVPHTFSVSSLEATQLTEHLNAMNMLGITISQTGPTSFILESIPNTSGTIDPLTFVSELLEYLQEGQAQQQLQEESIRRIAVMVSRTCSLQKQLLLLEAQLLMDKLMRCKSPYQCPLGHPTLICLETAELKKKFNK